MRMPRLVGRGVGGKWKGTSSPAWPKPRGSHRVRMAKSGCTETAPSHLQACVVWEGRAFMLELMLLSHVCEIASLENMLFQALGALH